MSTQITTQKVLAFDSFADFPLIGLEGYIYLDNSNNIGYLWDSNANQYVNIGGTYNPITPDPTPLAFVQAATVGILSFSPTYSNGTLGVGATLTATSNGILRDTSAVGKIDTNYTPVAGDAILVKNQANAAHNGLYTITSTGSVSSTYVLTRVADFNESAELYPLQVNVLGGLNNNLKFFNQTTVSPTIGTSSLVFAISLQQSVTNQIAFVDTVIDTPLSNISYANGTTFPSIPGLGATLTSTVNGALGTYYGLTANTNSNVANSFTRVLLTNQTNSAYNGDYQVVNAGSGSTKWQLIRINNTASGFNRYTRYFVVSNTGSTKAGKVYFTTPNGTPLTNAGIGTAAINIVEYGGSSNGKVGLLNSSGVYTYYQTLGEAMTAAVNGQTIQFFADTSETNTVTIKPRVTILGNGFGCSISGSSNISTLFIDSTGGPDYDYYIYNLKVSRESGGTNTNAHSLLISSGATGKRKIYCDGSLFLNSINGSNAINCQSADGSVSIYNARARSSVATQFGIFCETVNLYNCHSEGAAIGIQNNGININCVGISTGSRGLHIREGVNCIGISSAEFGIRSFGTGILNNCTAISSANSAWYVVSSSIITNCTAKSSAGFGFESLSLGSISNSLGYSSSTAGSFIYGQINNSTFISETNVGLYYLGSSTNSVINNCIIESKLNSSSGHALRIHTSTTTTPLVKGCTLITGNSLANCIFASGAVNIKTALNTYINSLTPVNVLVNTSTSPTLDSNGNITI